jgi:hypothetical protein
MKTSAINLHSHQSWCKYGRLRPVRVRTIWTSGRRLLGWGCEFCC